MDYRWVIQASMDYIEDNLKTEITAGELSAQAGFSLFYYCRLFQSVTGMPVMQYVLRRRLIHAIYEIRNGRKRVEAALEYGFDTYAGFYKAFQREFDCTPTAFLRGGRAKPPVKPNLFEEEHKMVTHKKVREILQYWNLENEKLGDIYYESNGNRKEDAFYVGEDHVLKFTVNLRKVKNNIELSRAMERGGLLAAVPVKTADGQEYVQDGELYFYLVRRISGKPIVTRDLYEGDSAAKARFIGELIGELHLALCHVDSAGNETDLYDEVKRWALPRAKEILKLPEAFCQSYLTGFGKIYGMLPRQIIHRDIHPGNIILSHNRGGFIDFDLSEKNIRIYDLCYAATAILSESFARGAEEKLCRWLEIYQNLVCGYDSVIKLTDEEREAIPYVILSNQLVCVAWFSEQEKYADIFETNKGMTLWILEIMDELRL